MDYPDRRKVGPPSADETQAIAAQFAACAHGAERLNREQFAALARSLDLLPDAAVLDQAFAAADLDGDGSIDLGEFIDWRDRQPRW